MELVSTPKTCGHSANRDRKSSFCHSCYMAAYRKRHGDAYRADQRRMYRERKKKDPAKVASGQRFYALKRKYGLSKQQYAALLDRHGNKCALCASTKFLCVDHCHETGRVRGILCRMCNSSLGKLGDSEQAILKVLQYLTNEGVK